MHIVIGILGIIFFLALAVLFSSDRKNIRWRYVGLLLVIQLIFAFILLKTNLGISVIGSISDGFNYLLAKAYDGDFIIRIEDTDFERNVEGGIDSQFNFLE